VVSAGAKTDRAAHPGWVYGVCTEVLAVRRCRRFRIPRCAPVGTTQPVGRQRRRSPRPHPAWSANHKQGKGPPAGASISCDSKTAPRLYTGGSAKIGRARPNRIVIDNARDFLIISSEFNFYLPHAYAKPNTTPRIRKAKYTLCAEWTMTPIQVLRKRQLGNAYRKIPVMTDPGIPQGW
jgi:hypothetical protein